MDRDRRRVLLRQREELVAELPCRRPVHLADHLDVDVTRVTGDGTGEHRLHHVEAPWPMRSPAPGPRVRAGQRRARAEFLDGFAGHPVPRVTDATGRAGLQRMDGTEPGIRRVPLTPDRYDRALGGRWPRPAPTCTARPASSPRWSGRSSPGARRRLRHRAGRHRAGPAGPRDRRGRRRLRRCSTGPGPRHPTSTGQLGDLATLPDDGRTRALRRRGARRQRDDLRRPRHRGRGARQRRGPPRTRRPR